jgi:transmembrane 9 superfamily protein 2/4
MVSLRVGATAAMATVLLALSTAPSTGFAFYIPGISPTVFREGERVPLYVNKIFSEKSPLPYAYADLPFVCAPPKDAKKAWLNLGEVLRGDRISTSDYEVTWMDLELPKGRSFLGTGCGLA